MAYTYQGDAILGVALSVETPKPLDTRTVVNATKDLYEVPASQAYRGMTISNLEDGNIYMLIDKNKINKSEGWKSSQSALQIISCTQEEYDKWSKNTDKDYNPIDPEEAYISQGIYYYIYEDEDNGQYYLSSEWGKNIEEQLSKKASNDAVTSLLKQVNEDISNLANNYTTTETLLVTYVTIASLEEKFNASNPDSYISKLIAQYYTKEEADSIFVTKASLGGDLDGLEGDNFVFVTSKQYAEDQQVIKEELDKTLKLDGEGSLESITVGKIKSPIIDESEQLEVEVTSEGLIINGDRLAGKSEIPVLITMSKAEYDNLTPEEINEEAYYYLYNTEEDLVYVTNKDLTASYHNIGQYQTWVAGYSYNRSDIDKIVATLQNKGDYVLLSQLQNYYTKDESDDKFLSKNSASELYATGEALTQLESKIESDYVTKESLKSGESDDEDFIFVTQKTYTADKEANAEQFSTKQLVTNNVTLKDIALTSEEARLLHNGEKLALVKELHKVEYLSENEYLDLVKNNKTVEDTYYYTYGQNESDASGYVQLDYIEDTYYTKRQIDNTIREINSEHSEIINSSIAGVQEQIDNLTNVILAELESRLQTQIDNMQIKSEVSEHILSLNDNDIMIVEGEVLHILSPSKVSVNGLQIVVD